MSKRTNQTFTPDRKIKACTRPSFVYQKPKGCKSVVNSVIERHVINYEDIDYAFYFVMCKVIYPNDPEGTSKVFLNPSNPNNHVLYAAQDLDPEIISDYLDAMPSKYQSRSSRIRVNRLLSQGPRTESEYCEARMSVELQRILLRQAKIIHGSISSPEKKRSLTVKESRLEDSSSEDSDESPQDVDESPNPVDESPEDSDESPEERLEKKKKGPTSAKQIANKPGEYSDSEDDDDFVVKDSQNSSQEENGSDSDDFSCSEEEDEENLELKTQEKQPEREVVQPNKPVTGLSLECETPQEKVKLVDKHDKSEGCFNINAFSSAYGIVDDCPFEQQGDVYEEQKSTEETSDDSNNKDEANPMEEENSFDIFSGIIEFVVDVGNTTPSTLGEKDEENVSLTIDGEHQPLLGNEDPTTQPPNDDEKQTLSEMDDSACQPTQFVEQPPVVEDEVLITQPPAEDEKQTCAEKDDSIAQPAKNDERNLIAVPNESIVQSSNDDKKDGNVETNQNNDNESFDGLFDGDSDSDTDTAKEQHQDTEMGKRKKSITVYESDDAMTEASEVPYPVEKDETASKEGKHSIQNPAQESVQEHIQEPVKGASNGRPKRQRASVAPKASKNSKGGVKKQRGRFSRPVESDEDSNVDDENDLSFYPSS